MNRVGIVITSKRGQTARIAEFLQRVFLCLGARAEVKRIDREPGVDLGKYDTVVLGCPVYIGKASSKLAAWVVDNLASLSSVDTAFFTVSLNAADKRPEARVADVRIIDEFIQRTGLKPGFTASFAGALLYREYNFALRWMMKRISRSAHGPTDTSRDYEMTDWAQVAAFARAVQVSDGTSPFALDSQRRTAQQAKPGMPVPA